MRESSEDKRQHLPLDWNWARFGDCARIANGQVDPRDAQYADLPHIGPENIESETGRLHGVRTSRQLDLISGKYLFDERAIVYSKIRPNLNKVALPGFRGVCSADAYPIWTAPDELCPKFLLQVMRSEQFVRQAVAASMRSGMPKINRPDLARIWIPVPSLREQVAIGTVLGTWDERQHQVVRDITALRKIKRGLVQQLLTGKRRFPEFRKQQWVEVPIGDLLQEVERYVDWSDDHEYRLVSVRRRSGGFFERERKRGRDILTKTLKTTRAGDFVLARMQVLHGAMTVTPPEFDGAHVSDSYMTLVPRDKGILHMPFFGYLSTTRLMYHKALISSVGVAIEKMSFNPRWWLAERVLIPPSLDEQKKIASVLQACDRELELLRQLHDTLKEQKKGLMQILLTGQVRVPASMLKEAPHA